MPSKIKIPHFTIEAILKEEGVCMQKLKIIDIFVLSLYRERLRLVPPH